MKPLVSVIIPCHGQAQFLSESVGSAAAQTLDDIEIIMVADGCADCLEEARELQSRVLSLRKIVFLTETDEGPRGLGAARNHGIDLADGQFIVCLDADDILEPTYLERCYQEINKSVPYAICATHYRAFGNTKESWRSSWDPDGIRYGNSIPYVSMFSRALWREVGGYGPELWEDWSFWIGASRLSPDVRIAPEELFQYRVHAGQSSVFIRAHEKYVVACLRLLHWDLYDVSIVIDAKDTVHAAPHTFLDKIRDIAKRNPKNEFFKMLVRLTEDRGTS